MVGKRTYTSGIGALLVPPCDATHFVVATTIICDFLGGGYVASNAWVPV